MVRAHHPESPPADTASFASLVRAWRERGALTQEQLAHRAGLSVGTVRGFEAGRIRRPRSRSLRQLAEALGLGDPEWRRLVAAARGEPPEVGDDSSTSAPSPSLLPAATADFTGREDHVASLEQSLQANTVGSRQAVAISVVQGRGGVGKTTLAVHVAHRLADAFGDGQLFLDLRGAQTDPIEPAHALTRLLRALGVYEPFIPDALDERAELYRARIAGRRCLVVLDNAASEAQVRPLLPGTPSCAVLITSRRRLAGLEGTRVVDLDVFEPDQAIALLARIAGPERTAAEPGAAHDLATLCGYLPLAVRIAGARLAARPDWRIAQLVERLSNERRRLDELVAGDLEVRASIGLSYMSLDDDTRRAFRLLGLLESPDFASWVVAALADCTVEQAIAHIDRLVTANLVEVAGADVTGHVRYRLHDLVRLYAGERAADEETDGRRRAALTRALGAWLALAEHADAQMPTRFFAGIQGDAPRWWLGDPISSSLAGHPMAWFETERANLVTAVTQACALGFDDLAWEIAQSAHTFFDWRSLLDDWEHTHTLALASCRQAHNTLGRAVMARNLTDLCQHRRRDRLISCADEAVAASREIGHRLLEADSLILWGVLHRYDHRATGRANIKAGLAIANSEGYVLGLIQGGLWLGIMHYESGQHEAAAASAELLLGLARRHDHSGGQFEALRLLGLSCRDLEMYQQSEQSFIQAMEITKAIGNRIEEIRQLAGLGELYVRWGRAEARPILERTLRLASEMGDDYSKAYAQRVLGELDLSEHHYESALTHLQSTLAANRQIGLVHVEARTLRGIGDAHAARGDPQSARSAWEQARSLYEQLGNSIEADSLTQRLVETN